ncbi:hypothetical protein E1B28_009820 [Marasmius oreades]|uniref:DUF300-domain-containing protein n=1 Tax=Marasmius oreades TaxID=181124 RepID=A0A9P7RVV0_9AGAR|nr:uncharacterized protein E1B28_009820 [Marasmius oreades]KAG7090729.1 hypothetical protein E1B28_009820 [Marasmius oreades]
MSAENERCFKERTEGEPSLLQNGDLVFGTHHVGWIIASLFTFMATAVSIWLVCKHLKWYTNKREQRHIVRILFMVPVYAIISLGSYFFWNHSTPLILLRDCYESTVLTSFFYLLLIYMNPDPEEQRMIFRKVGLSQVADNETLRKGEEIKKWVFPLGFIKWKPADGLYFLQAMKWGVLQYCVLRPLTTLAAVILDYIGLYCESSWSPGWGHIYLVVIVSLSVTVAMYCLIQLYVVSSEQLAPHKPLLKLFAIKAVVFLTFWQATFLGVLAMFGVVKDTKFMTAEDVNIGIGALLETFEMTLFAFLHVKAFTYKVYKPITGSEDLPPLPTNRLRALGHAMDFRETFRELWAGCVYMWSKMRGQEPKVDVVARRQGYYENAFGRARPSAFTTTPSGNEGLNDKDRDVMFPSVRVNVERTMEIGGRREWLGAGNYYGYGIYREKSEELEEQIEAELARRGYGRAEIGRRGNIKPSAEEEVGHPRERSWWRTLYNRISQSTEPEYESRLSPSPSRKVTHSKRRSSRRSFRRQDRDVEQDLLTDYRIGMDDPPPPSLIRKYRASTQSPQGNSLYVDARHQDSDALSPLSVYNECRHSQFKRQQQQQRGNVPPPMQLLPPSGRPADRRLLSPPVLGSSPPPNSLLLAPVVQQGIPSNDSLLERMFPSKTDLVSSTEHTDGGFMTSAPPSAENGHVVGLAGERRTFLSQTPTPVTPEVAAHRIDGLYRSPRNRMSTPTSPQASNSLASPQRSQVYSQQHLSRVHRQSLPAPGLRQNHMAYPPPPGHRFAPKVLTVPALLGSTHKKEARPPQYSPEQMDSTVAQSSFSGTPDVAKYRSPNQYEHLQEESSRYPGLLSTRKFLTPSTIPGRIPSYTNHRFPGGAFSHSNDDYESPGGFGTSQNR